MDFLNSQKSPLNEFYGTEGVEDHFYENFNSPRSLMTSIKYYRRMIQAFQE